jgi:O-antigen ligase
MNTFAPLARKTILVLAALTSFIVLYVASGLYFPYITGKGFLFRTLVELMLLIYIPLAVAVPEYRPKKQLGLIVYGVFILILFCAAILGVNPANSLWSNFERMEGFVTHIHLFVFVLILLSIRITEKEWKLALQTQLFAGVCVLFVAIGEYFTVAQKIAMGEQIGRRLAATLGNPAYLAIYSAFNIGIALLLLCKSKAEGYILPITYSIVALLHLFVLWQTQTRGTILGLVAGLGVALLWTLWKNRTNVKVRNISLAGVAIFVAILFSFISLKETSFIQNNPTLKRLADIELGEQTVRSRVMIWQMSFEGVLERPVLGYGQDNFIYVFADKYNPEMFDQEQWFDRSHNVFFDWLIAAGILGLLAYLSLYGISVYSIIANRQSRFSNTEQSVLLGMLVTYFVHNIIVFDNLISYISFFVLFAYITARIDTEKIQKVKINTLKVYTAALISVLFVGITFYHVVYKPYKLNTSIIQMFQIGGSSTLEGVKQIATQMTVPTLYGNNEANENLLTLVNMVLNSNASDEDKKIMYDFAKNIFDTSINKDAGNPRPAVIMGSFLSSLGAYGAAAQYYQEALERTPNKTLLWSELAVVYLAGNDSTRAEETARRAHELSVRSVDATQVLANVLYTQGKKTEAQEVWQNTIERNKYSEDAMKKEIMFYNEVADSSALKASADRFIEKYPERKNVVEEYLLESLGKK